MKAAVEVLKEGRRSVSTCSDEESKRTKFEKAKKQYPKIKGDKDVFCWTCHKSGKVATCSRCPRAYHLKCGHLDNIPESSSKWMCPECDIIQRANSQTSASQLKVLSQMLGYVIDRMKLVRGSEGFCEPVDTNKWHDYLDYVIKPMDIPKLAENVRRHMYKSTEDFLADFRWLVHDSYVYNSVHSAYTKTAKSMAAVAKQECEEIKNCADCYLHAYSLGENQWFIEPCTTPHVLVWAQLAGFPYWPGKVMKHLSGDMVDVRFFGDHSRANVPVTSCFLYSRLMPCAVKKNHPKIADGIEEAEQHVKRLRILYGNFYYAQYRIRYVPRDEDFVRKLQLPGFRKPGETTEFLKKVELERAEKMILDKDFQSEMKQMSTQSKKLLAPIKRKSVEKARKEGVKRMLVQFNTPTGIKSAIMNCSGSESDSSPTHVSEKTAEDTNSRLLIASTLKTTPLKRVRLSDKFGSLSKRTPQKTAPEKEAMIKQVEETSPKELADIYKSISPNKPTTPIKDSGIIESISRKLLTPISLRSIRATHESMEETPPSKTIDVEGDISSSVKFGQNGLQKRFRVLSSKCPEDSDGDSDALVIASRESSPIRSIDGTSPRTGDSPATITHPPVVSSEPGDSVLVSSSTEKDEEKSEITFRVLDSSFPAEKVPEKSTDNVPGIEEKNCFSDGVKEKLDNVITESDVKCVSDGESFVGTDDKILPSVSTIKNIDGECEPSNSISSVTGKSDSAPEGTDDKKIGAVAESGDGNCVDGKPVTENADDACDPSQTTSILIDGDLPPDKADKKIDSVALEIDRNGVLGYDSSAENIGENKKVAGCLTNSFSETITGNIVKPGNDESSTVGSEMTVNKNDRSVLDLLNGDLSQLYDNLASERSSSSSDESGIINKINAMNRTVPLDESRSGLSVESLPSSSSVSSSVHVAADIASARTKMLRRPELGVLPISTLSFANACIPKDHSHSSKRQNEVETGHSEEVIPSTTETVVDREEGNPQDVETTTSSIVANPDVPSCQPSECVRIGSVAKSTSDVTLSTTNTNPIQSLADQSTVRPGESVELESDESLKMPKESPKVVEGCIPNSNPTEKSVELSASSFTSLEKVPIDRKCVEIYVKPTLERDQPPKSTDVSVSISDGGNQKDLGLQASNSTNPPEVVVQPVDGTAPAKSSVKITAIVSTHSNTSDKVLSDKSVKNVETLARRCSSLGEGANDGLVEEKSPYPSEGKEELASLQPFESADEVKCKATKSTSNEPSVFAAQEVDKNFVTIASSMSLSHLSSADLSESTSARTHPFTRTLKPTRQKDPAVSAKRKVGEVSSAIVKKPKVKEVGKDVIASGMPRPIIIKVEPEDKGQEINDSPPPLTIKAAAGPSKPNIKIVQISHLMERPPPVCPSPQNNMIPPFNPKKDMSDVRALIEAKKQFISAKLKDDIYEMLDQIKADYESHIDLLTSVSDRQLQNFESTFETDKMQLYEDFKNKLRDQMDQQITEIKRKQWCANCGAEASFHCCWNHAYCGDKCQRDDWSTHSQNCTQYSMSASDPYIRCSPRFRVLLEKQHATGAARKISLQDLIDVPVAVSVQNSPPKPPAKKPKKVLGSMSAYSSVPTISIPECELPELPRPPPSAKSFLSAPVQRLNNGDQITFDNGKRAYRIIQQNPGVPKTLKVVGPSTTSRNPTPVNSYSGPMMRLANQGRSFAVVVGGDKVATKPNQSVTYGAVRKNIVSPPSSSGTQINRTQTVTIAKRVGSQINVVKKTPSVRVMEDNELASILARNHLRDAYVHASS